MDVSPSYSHSDRFHDSGPCRRVLYLFSGPDRQGSLSGHLANLGWECDTCDIEAMPPTDLLDFESWDVLFRKIESGHYAALFASPPCGTFSAARQIPDGPAPLRGTVGRELYGMTALSVADRLVVREHNWFAAQTAKTAQLFHQLGLLFGIENPARREGVPSLFELEEIKALQSLQGVQFKRFPQCAFGSPFQKYTEILGSLNLDSWASECTCKPQWWAIPWSGEAFHAPHPPLKGRQLAVPWNEWSPGMLRQAEPGGSYLTKATAHYPSLMNESLARALTCDSASMSVPLSKLPDSFPIEDLASSTEVKKRTSLDSQDLSRKSLKTQQGSALGGLRNTWRSVPRVPASINLGVQIRNLLDAKLNENPDVQEQLLGSIGTPSMLCCYPRTGSIVCALKWPY